MKKSIKKNGTVATYINWNGVNKIYLHPLKINQFLEENQIKPIRLPKGKKSKVVEDELYNKGFKRLGPQGQVEFCGLYSNDKLEAVPFRFGIKKAEIDQKQDSYDISGLDAWLYFKNWLKISKGLPKKYHENRTCAPYPIDWCNDGYTERELRHVNKADISSAYGYQLTNPLLPDLLEYKEVNSKVEPSEEWPFAFYLDNNSMTIYNEGSSLSWKDNRFATSAKKNIKFDITETRTLLMKGKDYGLKPLIDKMYAERSIKPENKSYMNLLVGFMDQKDYYAGQIVAWPIRAVIIYRCNQRILNLCEELKDNWSIPVLINTDSISWLGDYNPSIKEKHLGSFTTEYIDCNMIIRSVKCYQIKSGDEVLTRYSGPHTKSYISTLPFGALLEEDCLAEIRELEAKYIYKWDDESFRFINKKGQVFEYEE